MLRRIGSILSLIIVLVAACNVHAQEDTRISASVDKEELTVDENLTLTVSISSSGGGALPQPKLPPLSDFDLLSTYTSTNISMMNNAISSVNTYTYILQPLRTGELIIDPVELKVGKKKFSTSRITVNVKPSSGRKTSPPPSAGRKDDTSASSKGLKNAFVRTEVDKKSVYVSEQIILTFFFYNRLANILDLDYKPPSTSGFWTEEISSDKLPVREVLDGKIFDVQKIKTALFPTSPGKHRIDPANLKITYGTGFFSPRGVATLSSDPIEIEVKPLPEKGKPEGFGGAVGRYSIKAETDKGEVQQGDAVSLMVEIDGLGNIGTIGSPIVPKLDGFKLYEPKVSTKQKLVGEIIGGRKVFEYALIPEKSGKLTIDPFRFPYFDPNSESYKVAGTSPIYVNVAAGEGTSPPTPYSLARGEVDRLGEDIRFIKPDASELKNQTGFLYGSPIFWGIQIVPFLGLLCAAAYRRWKDKALSDMVYVRKRRAKKEAKRKLKDAAKFVKSEDSHAFHSEIYKALAEFMGDKLNMSPAGVTTGDISARLKEKGIGEEDIEGFIGLMNQCDMARFAPGSASVEDMKPLLSDVSKLIEKLDNLLQ